MATTYSTSLKLALIGDGDQAGIWGQTTNTNLGTLLEQAITGVQSITMVDANYTLTNFNGVTNEARNAILVVTGTNNAIRDLIPPVVEKLYTIVNNTAGGYAIRVIGGSGTGVNIPNGATCLVYCDGTNFVNGLSGSAGNFSVAGALAVTGATALTGALSGSTAAFSGAISSVSPAFTGTPTAPTASPGTNTTQIATTAFVNAATGAFGTMATQNANNVSITGGTITGITDLTVADGGTGASTFTANSVVLGNGTSSLAGNMIAPGTSGNVLTSNGSTWASTTPPFTKSAWVYYNGSSIASSYNIASVTNPGTGFYTITFTNAFSDANYMALGTGQADTAGITQGILAVTQSNGVSKAAGSLQIVRSRTDNGAAENGPFYFYFFGN